MNKGKTASYMDVAKNARKEEKRDNEVHLPKEKDGLKQMAECKS